MKGKGHGVSPIPACRPASPNRGEQAGSSRNIRTLGRFDKPFNPIPPAFLYNADGFLNRDLEENNFDIIPDLF